MSLACGEYPAVSSLCYMPHFKKLTLVGRTEEGGRPGIVLVRAWFPCGGGRGSRDFHLNCCQFPANDLYGYLNTVRRDP